VSHRHTSLFTEISQIEKPNHQSEGNLVKTIPYEKHRVDKMISFMKINHQFPPSQTSPYQIFTKVELENCNTKITEF